MFKLVFSLLIVFIFYTFLPYFVLASTYYVAPNKNLDGSINSLGNDSNNGTSISTPLKTFTAAFKKIFPGDTLILLDGIYTTTLQPNWRNGTQASPITIKAQNDGKAIIDGEFQRAPIEIGEFWTGESGYVGNYFNLEGLYARNSNGTVVFVTQNAVGNTLKRISAYNANPDTNDHVILVWGTDTTVEDCVASGTGRNMIILYGNGSANQNNVVRRCAAFWTKYEGKQFCGVNYPNGNNFVIYNSSGNKIENSIAYGNTSARSFLVQANSDAAKSNNNQILGSIAMRAGYNWDGTLRFWDISNPPTRVDSSNYNCTGMVAYYKDGLTPPVGKPYQAGWRAYRNGGQVYGQGTINNIVWKDYFSYGNAGLGFVEQTWVGTSPSTGMSGGELTNVTLVNNGLDAPASDGGIGKEFVLDNPSKWTITNSKIEGSTYQGMGAKLDYRYVNGSLTSTPLWLGNDTSNPNNPKWVMEDRIKKELAEMNIVQNFSLTGAVYPILSQNGTVTLANITPQPSSTPVIPTPTPSVSTPSSTVSPTPTSSINPTITALDVNSDGVVNLVDVLEILSYIFK